MKNVYIDFNCDYYISSYEYESEVYNSDIRRLVISKVIEVKYKNGYVVITYKTNRYKKGKNTTVVEIKSIENMIIN